VIHSLPSHSKIVAAFFFIVIAVSTPVQRWEAFVGFFFILFMTVAAAKIPFTLLFKRALIEIPFIFFALLMPFFGTGERFEVGPLNLYREGLLAGAGIFIKGTLGVITAIILSTSTQAREILRGLERLKLPTLMVQIASFMLRYVNVVNDEMERMKIARESRGFEATGVKHWKVIATAAGALFIRSYERGERVHLARISRGYDGVLPHDEPPHIPLSTWLRSLTLPISALIISLTTLVLGF
jgi:cobalt/nickel transport system permease protein